MKIIFRPLILLVIVLLTNKVSAQSGIQFPKSDTTAVKQEYPYILPIWGKELTKRNIKFQLPFGINANYVYNKMELEMTEFSLDLNGRPIDGINEDTMGFQPIIAKTSGLNVRADIWLFPFLNFYGIYAESNGSTQIAMTPFGSKLITLDPVPFRSSSLGVGATFVYGWRNVFVSGDVNFTNSSSDILEDKVGFMVASARVGKRVQFKNNMAFAVYIGGMYRNFVGHEANHGNVLLAEYFPELKDGILDGIDNRILRNEGLIDDPNYPYTPDEPTKIQLRLRNEGLNEIYARVDSAPPSQVNYSLKKEIIQPWSLQVGFNYEITEHWMYRGELGYSSGQTFLLTGLQYRFGL